MKIIKPFYLTTLIILIGLFFITNSKTVDAQAEYILYLDSDSCSSSGGCEVVTRQYTGAFVFYSVSIRCADSGGNYGGWSHWMYSGINPGTYCN